MPEKQAPRGRTPPRSRVDAQGPTGQAVADTFSDEEFKTGCFRPGPKGGKWRKVAVVEGDTGAGGRGDRASRTAADPQEPGGAGSQIFGDP